MSRLQGQVRCITKTLGACGRVSSDRLTSGIRRLLGRCGRAVAFTVPVAMHLSGRKRVLETASFSVPIPERLSGLKLTVRQRMKLAASGTSAFLGLTRVPVGPLRLQVEPVPYCNLLCPACPRSFDEFERHDGFFETTRFERLLHKFRPLIVNLTGYGETMMHPKLLDLLKISRSYKAHTNFTTNATMINSDSIRDISDAGLDSITVSLDSVDPKTYEQIRKGDTLEKLMSRLDSLFNENSPLRNNTYINTVLFGFGTRQLADVLDVCATRFGIEPSISLEISDRAQAFGESGQGKSTLARLRPTIDAALAVAKERGLQYAERRLGYHVEMLEADRSVHIGAPCMMPWTNLTVYADGQVTPCCFWRPESPDGVLGNINDQTLDQIWNGEAAQKLRAQHIRGRSGISTCMECGYADWDVDNVFRRAVKLVPFLRLITKRRFASPRPKFAIT